MRAVKLKRFGGPEELYIGDSPEPEIGATDVLIAVRATALNRADLLQRRGFYPPPPGASEVLGLEASGEVIACGHGVTQVSVGDRVCALLPGGGYSERVAVPEGMVMKVPSSLSFEQAAAIPEVFLTAYLNLCWLGRLNAGDRVLVHAGASGVGTAAIQIARELGATVYVTAGSAEKLNRCRHLGASAGWNYHDGSFRSWVVEETAGRGVDVILDFIGAPYFANNLAALAMDGRLVIVGTMGGSDVEGVNLGYLLSRRLQVIGTALRTRSVDDKIRLSREFSAFAWPRFADGRLQPIIDSVYDWTDVAVAHRRMEQNQNIGKIILCVTSGL